MAFAIICDARKGEDLGISTLGLVDRAKTRATWWTSDNPALLLDYRLKTAAEFACKKLRKNNARVVPIAVAVKIINEQANHLDHLDACDSLEMGWDGHKIYS